jgi:hypothetical protein
MPHRAIRSPHVEIDGAPLPSHEGDVFHVWPGDLLSYRGLDDSPVRRALQRAGDSFTLSISGDDDDEPLVATAVPVGPQDSHLGQTMIFCLHPTSSSHEHGEGER